MAGPDVRRYWFAMARRVWGLAVSVLLLGSNAWGQSTNNPPPAPAAQQPPEQGRPVQFSADPVDPGEQNQAPPQAPPAQPPPDVPPPYPPPYPQVPPQASSPGYYPPAQTQAPAPRVERELPDELPYREGPPPPGYRLEESTRKGLWIPGISMFGGAYALSVLVAQPSQNNGTSWLYVPVFGPWITIAECTECDDLANSALAFDGLIQSAGVTLFILGLTLTQKKFVRTYVDAYGLVVPQRFSQNGYGLSFVRRF